MPKQDTLLYSGHRERLRQKFLDDKITEYEKLELLLGYAIPRKDVRVLSRTLFQKFGNMYQILSAPISELESVDGIGKNTAVFLKVIQQIMLDGFRSFMSETPVFHNQETFENYCKLMLGNNQIEEMHILYLDASYRLIKDETHSKGTTNWTTLIPREFLRTALELRAKSVALVHNHPTPNTSFSEQDVTITKETQHLLESVQINLYDHYVVSGGVLYSMRNMLLLG